MKRVTKKMRTPSSGTEMQWRTQKRIGGSTSKKKFAHPQNVKKPLHNEVMNYIEDKFVVNIGVQ
jgi:mRNA-degrading endonuclease HigB of HigAB toxin-antitoxin module